MPDKYDEAIAYLAERPGEITWAWMNPTGHVAGCLFQYATPSGRPAYRPDGKDCGCLTGVRLRMTDVAWTEELTHDIQADHRIPQSHDGEVTVADLPVFAEWQRKIDKELNREGVK